MESGQGMMGKIKGAAATVHGTGEALRGAFNTSVDKMAGDVSFAIPLAILFLKFNGLPPVDESRR